MISARVTSGQGLPPVIQVDPEKCVSCHACILHCPVKHCNDASGDHVAIDHDLCIGCGACIKACQHGARVLLDDTPAFLADLRAGVRIVAVVAPAVAAVFPDRSLHFNGWLKSLGVSACFDVSFGAELTVKSYLDHVERKKPPTVIAQPCPALVTYIEVYRPELLPYLAPADSPMLHTARMVRTFRPQYRDHRIAVVSPCGAKRREFAETGVGDYNVTFNGLIAEMQRRGQTLASFDEQDYDNPPAERAVLFSTPGGLLRTAERWNPQIGQVTRKIEGPHSVYHYLDELPTSISRGHAPLLVDCLNCELGCNGGPGTPNQGGSQDEVEHAVAKRAEAMRRRHAADAGEGPEAIHAHVVGLVEQFWKPGIYDRSYVDRSASNTVRRPDESQMQAIFKTMEKHGKDDVLNCGACGYGKCSEMAVAIFNKMNKADNCHLFKQRRIETLLHNAQEMERIADAAARLSATVEEMHTSVAEIARNAMDAASKSGQSIEQARHAGTAMSALRESGSSIDGLAKSIASIAAQTRLLALNATIEAARAGDHGRGFAVVANEVKELARVTGEATDRIAKEAQAIALGTANVAGTIGSVLEMTESVGSAQHAIAGATRQQESAVAEMSRQVHAIVAETQERLSDLGTSGKGLARATGRPN